MRRALATSLVVPAVAWVLAWLKASGPLQRETWLSMILVAMASIPTVMHLLTAAAGHPWEHLERDWHGLHGWQRAISSVVALFCGLTAGAAVVLLILSLAEFNAAATEPAPSQAPEHQPAVITSDT